MTTKIIVRAATCHSFVRKPLHHGTATLRFNIMCRRYKTTSAVTTPETETSINVMKETKNRHDVTYQQHEEFVNTTLKEVPMLPFFGSLIPLYSNTPAFKLEKMGDYWTKVRRRYGNFYKFGFPGIGKGIYGELYIIYDPNEMMKVLRQEKTSRLPYPRGAINSAWAMIKHFNQTESLLTKGTDTPFDENGFFGRGETWKRYRLFFQTDLLSPQSAKGYIPGMVQAAQIASKAAPASTNNLNEYINRCAFDMFNSLMFGELTKAADLNTANDVNVQFCNDAVEAISKSAQTSFSIYQNVVGRVLGIETSKYKAMSAAFTRLFDTSASKYYAFCNKYKNNPGQLTDLEKESYLARAIERQKVTTNFSTDDLLAIIKGMLTAAVDTTSSPMGWNLYHIAVNQDAQEALYKELSNAIEKERQEGGNGCITENILKRSTCPYLHAVIRESHRITPATQIAMRKENSFDDIEIHGTIIPKDSLFMFQSYALGVDREFVDDPIEFKPERWLDDAVEARKGTKLEILDHPFLKDPFSQGSRKCPGSRVANNEVAILLSQLVLDWKITAPSNIKSVKDMEYKIAGFMTPKLPKLTFSRRV